MRRGLIVGMLLLAIAMGACRPQPIPPPTQAAPPSTAPPIPTDTPVVPTATAFIPAKGCVVGANLRVRQEPNTHSVVLGGLMNGTCVTVQGVNSSQDWAWIYSGNLAGWVSLSYLAVNGDVAALPLLDQGEAESGVATASLANSAAQASPTRLPATQPPANTPAPAAPAVLQCADTSSHIGEFVSCEIPRASCAYHPEIDGSPTFCNYPPDPNHQFTLLVWGSDWSDLDGQCVIVKGLVVNYEGKPEIEARSRSDIARCQ
jgi:uncharacterized protein YraI